MSKGALHKLFHHLHQRPEARAFVFGDESRTFGELDRRARSYACGLRRLGVEKGDRVVAILPSCLELVDVLVGHHRAGIVHVPVNTRYRHKELKHILNDAAPKALVVGAETEARAIVAELTLPVSVRHIIVVGDASLRDGEASFAEVLRAGSESDLEESPALADDDLALFIYTSGTTGPSKGVAHTYESVVSGIDALTTLWQWSPADRLVLALPLFHVHGLCIGIHGTLLRGNETWIQERFEPAQVAGAVDQGGTIFMGVPTMHNRLVEAMEADEKLARAMSKARLVTSGSAALRPDVFERFQALTGHRILERYGMSETMLTLSNPYEGERRPGTVGFAVPGIEARIVDEEGGPVSPGVVGELQVKGESVMRGYWGLPERTEEAFSADGFFRTGDVALFDDDGYIHLKGRQSVDIIKSGGFKISAREIEDVLRTHPGISEVAVVGLPDKEWGELIAAAVVAREGVEKSAEEWRVELEEHGAGALADFKKVRRVVLLEEDLPRNALGKVQKHRIKELFEF